MGRGVEFEPLAEQERVSWDEIPASTCQETMRATSYRRGKKIPISLFSNPEAAGAVEVEAVAADQSDWEPMR